MKNYKLKFYITYTHTIHINSIKQGGMICLQVKVMSNDNIITLIRFEESTYFQNNWN